MTFRVPYQDTTLGPSNQARVVGTAIHDFNCGTRCGPPSNHSPLRDAERRGLVVGQEQPEVLENALVSRPGDLEAVPLPCDLADGSPRQPASPLDAGQPIRH